MAPLPVSPDGSQESGVLEEALEPLLARQVRRLNNPHHPTSSLSHLSTAAAHPAAHKQARRFCPALPPSHRRSPRARPRGWQWPHWASTPGTTHRPAGQVEDDKQHQQQAPPHPVTSHKTPGLTSVRLVHARPL